MFPTFPAWRLQPLKGFLRFFISPPPNSFPVLVSTTSLVSVPSPNAAPIFCSSLGFHPCPPSRSRSVPVHVTVYVPDRTPDPAPVSVPNPDPVRSFPSVGPIYPLDTTRVYRYQASRTELSGARERRPPSVDMVCVRNESACCKRKVCVCAYVYFSHYWIRPQPCSVIYAVAIPSRGPERYGGQWVRSW